MKYQFSIRTFRNKAQVVNYLKRLLSDSPLNSTLKPEDRDVVVAMIGRHPSRAEKIGCGIKDIIVRLEGVWRRRQFAIVRTDGSITDFSYKRCLDRQNDRSDFRQACRRAVSCDIVVFKHWWFANTPTPIPMPGVPNPMTCHVHHLPPSFKQIVSEFINENGIDLSSIVYAEGDNVQGCEFADVDLAKKFRAFHRAKANLRIITPEEHKELTRCQQEDDE